MSDNNPIDNDPFHDNTYTTAMSQLIQESQDVAMAGDDVRSAAPVIPSPSKKRKLSDTPPAASSRRSSPTLAAESEDEVQTQLFKKKEHIDPMSLYDVTILGDTSPTEKQDIATAATGTGSWIGGLWRAGPTAKVVDSIELNNCGDIYVQIRTREPKYALQNSQFPVIQVRCSLNTIRDLVSKSVHAETRMKWLSLFPENGGRNRTVIMPADDDEFALLFVLRVAHGKHADLPLFLEFDQVLELAVLCHKYGIGGDVRTALVQRIQPLLEYETLAERAEVLKEQDGDMAGDMAKLNGERMQSNEVRWFIEEGKEQWLFVACTFGFVHSFKHLLNYLVLISKVDQHKKICTASGPLRGRFPTEVLKHVVAMRKTLLDGLLDVTYDCIKSLVTAGLEASTSNHHDLFSNKECLHAAQLCGTFIIHLAKIELNAERPSMNSRKVQKLSVFKLERHLKTIEDFGANAGDKEEDEEENEEDEDMDGDEDGEEDSDDNKEKSTVSASYRARMYWHRTINKVLENKEALPKHFETYLAQQAEN